MWLHICYRSWQGRLYCHGCGSTNTSVRETECLSPQQVIAEACTHAHVTRHTGVTQGRTRVSAGGEVEAAVRNP